MKKSHLLIVAVLCMFTVIGLVLFIQDYNTQSNEDISASKVDNSADSQKYIGVIKAEIEVLDFKDSIKEADLIAKVKVGAIIEELDEPSPKTLIQMEIKNVLKGSSDLKTINVLQQGNSKWLFNDNEILKENQEYILFLKTAITVKQPNSFWILGEETGMYEVLNSGNLKKLSRPEKDLSDIVNINLTKYYNDELTESKEVQVINEDLFNEKIKKYTSN